MGDDTEMIEKWKYDLSHAIWEKDQRTQALALEKSVRAICLGEKDNFETYLWEIIEVLGGPEAISLIKKNKELAYFIYCQGK